MLPAFMLALAMVLFSPWWPEEGSASPTPEARLPIVVLARGADQDAGDGVDPGRAAIQVLDGVAARLRSKRLVVQEWGQEGILIYPVSEGDPAAPKPSGRRIVLTVAFNSGTTTFASGTETRFGGEGDEAWRLAYQIQRNLVRGLWDVLAYDTYDRGIVEEPMADTARGRPAYLSSDGDPWVSAYPLFATNPVERDMLRSPEVLDLLSSALANALFDYLSPARATPERSARLGWRVNVPWRPVTPVVLSQAEQTDRLALTFDGGASSLPTPAILQALREAGVHATIFLTADFVEKNPELVVQMARDGHEFGNHSATHPDMTRVSSQAMAAELDKLEADVVALTGKSTRPWFRPPFGAYNDRVVKTAAELGYYTVLWTADSADWREDVSSATVESRLLRYAAQGAVLIEHLGSPQSAQVLPGVLARLKERGFSFATLSQLFVGIAP